MNANEAYIVLNQLPGIGPVRVNQLLTVFGEPQAILQAAAAELARVPGVGGQLAAVLVHWRDHVDLAAHLAQLESAGVAVLTPADAAYPALLRQIYAPPLCLYGRGELSLLARLANHGVAIVGSRRTTHYGVQIADNLAAAAGHAGWCVVSGLARGIDTVAHQACLRVCGGTVAVLGSGLARIYPHENVELARRIVEAGGLLLSELPLQTAPDRRTFPMRNRIIAGCCPGTIVVEAGERSGSLITATHALEEGRHLFAVPGPVTSPQSRGCHALLKDGATLIETFADVVAEYRLLPGLRSETAARVRHERAPEPLEDLQLSDLERTLLAALGSVPMGIDDLVATVDQPPGQVLRAVIALEMRHLLKQLPGKRLVRADGNQYAG